LPEWHENLHLQGGQFRLSGGSIKSEQGVNYKLNIQLLDLEFKDNHIYVELQDCTSGLFIHKSFDIDNPEFVFSLISWDDVRQMVLGKINSVSRGDDLLEFEL
jgi:hypothetical protein